MVAQVVFLSTPSGWRATGAVCSRSSLACYFYPRPPGGGRPQIAANCQRIKYFYPRPPGGGRQDATVDLSVQNVFLSTPSGWRATEFHGLDSPHRRFLSTPSGWRATFLCDFVITRHRISIHALRVEGDLYEIIQQRRGQWISIHALRVEGDSKNGQSFHLFLRKREKNLPL